jgi:hypothetical protein
MQSDYARRNASEGFAECVEHHYCTKRNFWGFRIRLKEHVKAAMFRLLGVPTITP